VQSVGFIRNESVAMNGHTIINFIVKPCSQATRFETDDRCHQFPLSRDEYTFTEFCNEAIFSRKDLLSSAAKWLQEQTTCDILLSCSATSHGDRNPYHNEPQKKMTLYPTYVEPHNMGHTRGSQRKEVILGNIRCKMLIN